MTQEELSVFNQLIEAVSQKIRAKHPELDSDMTTWVGRDIELLQDDLLEATGSNISEKWFYTHVKGEQDKLPRIDTLDLLSQFLGFSGWKDFQYQTNTGSTDKVSASKKKNSSTTLVKIIVVILALVSVGYLLSKFQSTPTFQFCFIDKNTRQPIFDTLVEVNLTVEGESSKNVTVRNQCFSGEGSYIVFEVKGKYYKPFQVIRSIETTDYYEEIALTPDDFALAIHLFSKQNLKDWKKRKQQLTEMIHPNARIYQVNEMELGVDIYNKEDFINRLMLPTSGLKNIEILETTYLDGKIYSMRILRK